ncbi:MAG TPA: hypothetical protein H9809_11400 [Candidatus Blautia pullicola]|uniref:Uncharacterized protein n=1 Tax=Candidatus Blautia pullicola TaxID=2838498 RepID=A0A9D2FTC9_9FIRM|nr:hypothetical protein [Candidatus Blautia pullicola]
MKKIYLTPVLLITLLAAGGCGAQTDEAESENVSLVLSNLFSSIDQEDFDAFNSWESGTAAPDWIEEDFQNLMTEKCYDSALETGLFMIPVKAFQSGTDLELKDPQLSQQEDSYSFTGTLTLEKEGQESQSLSIEGSAQVDQDGKVSYISISNMNEISQAIQ